MAERFTRDGSDALEARLTALCGEVADGLRSLVPPPLIEALVLGGGYGRGEGGVLRTPGGDAPYNDFEFFVFLRGPAWPNERRYAHRLHELGEALSPKAGMDVEFKIVSRTAFRAAAVNMFYYDLVMGHRCVIGDESIFRDCDHHRNATGIPTGEAVRLLFNRCSGLLFSKERLQRREFTAADADFVCRNLAKAKLAFGDAWLASQGHYHWSCRERHERLATLASSAPLAESLLAAHAEGVEFKLHPRVSTETHDELVRQWESVTRTAWTVWQDLARRQGGEEFATPAEYAASHAVLCPGSPGWRNRLVHAKHFGFKAALERMSGRYPRERLFRSLAVLLWGQPEAGGTALVQGLLRTEAADFPGLIAAYRDWWNRFN